jgi:hypothetical protein
MHFATFLETIINQKMNYLIQTKSKKEIMNIENTKSPDA